MEHDRLGHLEEELVRLDACCLDDRADVVDEPRFLELLRGEVHCHRQELSVGIDLPPPGCLHAGLVQHIAAERPDQTGLLRERDEIRGVDEPPRGVPPADERLEARDPTRPERDDRLEIDRELAAAEASRQLGAQRVPLHDRGVHRRLEDRHPVLPRALRGIHRHIGVAQQLCRADLADPCGRDTDARTDGDLLAIDREGRTQDIDDPVRHGRGMAQLGAVVEQHRELVAAETRRDVTRSEDLA